MENLVASLMNELLAILYCMTRRVEMQWVLFAIAGSIAFQPCDSALHTPRQGILWLSI